MQDVGRRGFLQGLFGGVVAGGAGLIVTASPQEVAHYSAQTAIQEPVMMGPVVTRMRADGRGYIVGVAAEDVRAGDIVQIQTYGPSTVRLK